MFKNFSREHVKYLFSVLICAYYMLCSSCIAQENTEKAKPYLSSEVFFVYPNYLTKHENQFNYGFGGAISENFNPFKVTIGLFYNTKKYFVPYESASSIDKITYSLNYFNVPILISFHLIKHEIMKNNFLITTGIVLNIPRNYHSLTYFKNNNPPQVKDTPIKYISGNSIRLGFQYNKSLNKLFNVFAGACVDYRFQLDHVDFVANGPHPGPNYYEGDRLLLGINIGIEWICKRR